MVLIFPPVNEPLIFAVNMEKITINQNIREAVIYVLADFVR